MRSKTKGHFQQRGICLWDYSPEPKKAWQMTAGSGRSSTTALGYGRWETSKIVSTSQRADLSHQEAMSGTTVSNPGRRSPVSLLLSVSYSMGAWMHFLLL